MRQGRSAALLWGTGVLVVAGWACETTRNPGGIQRDLTKPSITLSNTAGDSQIIAGGLRFTVHAADNLALKDIRVTYSGGFIFQEDTTFFSVTVKDVTIQKTVQFPSNSGAGGRIQIVARATDGAGNFSEDTIQIFLVNVQALQVTLVAPASGALASTGKGIPIQVIAVQNSGIRKVGFLVTPPTAVTNPTTPPADSIRYAGPVYQDSVVYTDTLTVTATTGTFSVVGFAEDSAGRRGTSNAVTVFVQSAANDTTKPVVSHTVGARVEVSDSVTVHATDPSGILWMGMRIKDALTGTVLRFDSVPTAGTLTDLTRGFSLNLAAIITSFPKSIIVQGYACDAATARNCAFSTQSIVIGAPLGAPPAGIGFAPAGTGTDTIVVVAGVTRPLPAGGKIADAIYSANRNELYLTNPELSRVEIFQVANTSFVAAGIPTAGPQPWGIALWPRDTLGAYGDSIVVANSGGTELSIIDVTPAVRRLRWRQDLPNFVIEQYKVLNVGGVFTAEITPLDVSDRPQYLGTVCRPAGGTLCSADSIFAVYTTTPTVSSTSPFNGRATLRLEKLINTTDTTQLFGHLYWEIGATNSGSATDTLRIELRRGRPYNQAKVILSACAGVTINFSTFGLGDTTFVRNSGNFTHAFVGEGGTITTDFARVMGYTAKAPLLHGLSTFLGPCFTSPDTVTGPVDFGENDTDFGMSPGVDVSDFISNTGIKVSSIATNFNGGTNLVRADSIYFLDEGLRLKGTSPAPTGAPGMDMNYNHAFAAGQGGTPTFGGTGNPNDRLVFAARPDGNIDVFDTFFYGFIGSVPVRDAITGPLRVAKDALGNQLLFGVTARGLVTVRLPVITNPFPAPRRAGSEP